MTIEEQLADDLKQAMKSHDDVLRDVVRLMRAALKNAEIEKRGTLDEASVEAVLARMAKQYRDSIVIYRDAGRTDLSDKEEAELAVVMRYLPEQLGADDIASLARAAAEEVGATGPGDRGKVMGKLMPQLKGRGGRGRRQRRCRRNPGVASERVAAVGRTV